MFKKSTDFDWFEAALSLRRQLGDDALEPATLPHLQKASRVLVACSGGADSVFLLCMLVTQAQELDFDLQVAHYNHRWRGEDSDADAAFVESLAAAFKLRFLRGIRPAKKAAFTETTARMLRLEFLRHTAQQEGCAYIAFGHQLDDIMETQLQRIVRGCASDGLAAPRPVAFFAGQATHLRPLLHLRAGDIRHALDSNVIPWRKDLSNHDVRIARNALRQRIIPDLAEVFAHDPSAGAARSRRLLEEDAVALDTLARAQLPAAYGPALSLDCTLLRAVPTALLRRALVAWLSGHQLIDSVGARALDNLIEAVRSERIFFRMSAGRHFIRIEANTLCWERFQGNSQPRVLQSTTLLPGESLVLSTGARIAAEVLVLNPEQRRKIESGGIDSQREAYIAYAGASALHIRAWKPGDRFHPLGAPGRKKLKDCFTDRRVPRAERKTLPLVLDGHKEVIWVPGFPPAESCKIHPETKQALRLTYERRNPL